MTVDVDQARAKGLDARARRARVRLLRQGLHARLPRRPRAVSGPRLQALYVAASISRRRTARSAERPTRRGAGRHSSRRRRPGIPPAGRPTPRARRPRMPSGAGAGRSGAGPAQVGRRLVIEVGRAQGGATLARGGRRPRPRATTRAGTRRRAACPPATPRAATRAERRRGGCSRARGTGRSRAAPRTADTARSARPPSAGGLAECAHAAAALRLDDEAEVGRRVGQPRRRCARAAAAGRRCC